MERAVLCPEPQCRRPVCALVSYIRERTRQRQQHVTHFVCHWCTCGTRTLAETVVILRKVEAIVVSRRKSKYLKLAAERLRTHPFYNTCLVARMECQQHATYTAHNGVKMSGEVTCSGNPEILERSRRVRRWLEATYGSPRTRVTGAAQGIRKNARDWPTACSNTNEMARTLNIATSAGRIAGKENG
jgi:hypothetical protein